MTLHLRPASTTDWDAAWAIQREAFRELVTATWGGWTDEMVQKCADAWDPVRTRLMEDGSELVGWVRVEHHPDHDWLDLVVVDPRHQGRGIGTEVLRVLLAEAETRRVPLWLSVYRSNPARRLYARLGFAELARDEIRVFMVHPASTRLAPPR